MQVLTRVFGCNVSLKESQIDISKAVEMFSSQVEKHNMAKENWKPVIMLVRKAKVKWKVEFWDGE